MMHRRTFLVIVAAPLVVPFATQAEQASKLYRVGWLDPELGIAANVESFQQGLRELGYVEGQNIVIEYRWAQGNHQRLLELAADLVRLRVDVIVGVSNAATTAAKQSTTTIPIVMVQAIDAVGQGYISSLARPGRNITGVSWEADVAIAGKYVELLKEAVPNLSRLANLLDPDVPGIGAYRRANEDAARRQGIATQFVEIRGPSPDLENAFRAMVQQRAQATVVFGGPMTRAHLRQIVDLAAEHRIAAIYVWREAVALGGLMSYGINSSDAFRRAAAYVDKILKGAQPATLPVEQPTKFDFAINLKTAKALGLTIPPSLLQRADQVIE